MRPVPSPSSSPEAVSSPETRRLDKYDSEEREGRGDATEIQENKVYFEKLLLDKAWQDASFDVEGLRTRCLRCVGQEQVEGVCVDFLTRFLANAGQQTVRRLLGDGEDSADEGNLLRVL